jgi:hypothetical protein
VDCALRIENAPRYVTAASVFTESGWTQAKKMTAKWKREAGVNLMVVRLLLGSSIS